MLRIAYLSSQSAYYGGEIHLRQLATGMRRRGHDVGCVVRSDSVLRRRLSTEGISLHLQPLVDWFDPLTVYRLRRWLRERRVQILHTHLPRDYYLAAVATLGTPVVNIGTRHQLYPLSQVWLKRPFLNRFAAMIAVSEAVRQRLLASGVMPPEKVCTVYNGVALERQRPTAAGLRQAVGLGRDTPVIGFVGRLCPEKGIETLLAAAKLLITNGSLDLRLFIVGDDPAGGRYARQLRQLVARYGLTGAVHFFGYVEDAADACADFDVQAVCSTAEPFGLVTAEAMARHRPVVATAAGGSGEIVRDGVDGFLVPPGDPVRLARRLGELLARPALRRRLGRNARRRIEQCFSLEQMLDRTETIYYRVISAETNAGSTPPLDLFLHEGRHAAPDELDRDGGQQQLQEWTGPKGN